MTDTAQALQDSRRAAAAARVALKNRQRPEMLALFQTALDERLKAQKLDPTFTDPEWEGDLLSNLALAGSGRSVMRRPNMNQAEMIAVQNSDLIAYYRLMLGQASNPFQVSGQPEKAVIVPEHWVMVAPGIVSPDTPVCEHKWQEGGKHRVCQACGQRDKLVPTMAREDTIAFRQLTKEQRKS